jgi:hypothetical protein
MRPCSTLFNCAWYPETIQAPPSFAPAPLASVPVVSGYELSLYTSRRVWID